MIRFYWRNSFLLLLFLLPFTSCKKEYEKIESPKEAMKVPVLEGAMSLTEVEQTVLGEKRINPYTVENMTAAWNQLYPEYSETILPTTDLYVRFHPKTPQEFKDLQEAINAYDVGNNSMDKNDPHLFDFPLEYEVEQAGNFYHDPSLSEGEITYQYAVVPPDFQFPGGVAYTVIADLVLAPYSSFLTAEAFRRTGNDYYNANNEKVSFCETTCPNYPNCLADGIDCETGTIQAFGVPCFLSPLWPFCLGNAIVSGLPTATGGTATNSCGCPIDEIGNKPGGCVQVEDTQLGWEGVKNVKVCVRDLWFTTRSTWTTNEGCWSISLDYLGPIQGWVQYTSSRMTISGLRDIYVTEFGHPISQNIGVHLSGYTDLQVHHHRHTDNSRMERMVWFASLANNAVYEYDWYSAQEGLPPAAPNLNIMLMNEGATASAPMLSHIMRTSPGAAVSVVSGFSFAGSTAAFTTAGVVDLFLPGTSLLVGALMPVFMTHMLANLPDMIYLYGDRDISLTSDLVKRTIYHESAHTAHYYALTDKNDYWIGNIRRIIDNGGYGQKGTGDFEKTALIESWAYHIGNYFADLHYGTDNFYSAAATNVNDEERKRFVYKFSEGDDPYNQFDPETYWLQRGVYWDLMDDRAHNVPPLNIPDPVKDSVSGFSNFEIFTALTTNNRASINQVKNALINFHPAQSDAIDTLYKEYGY